MKALDENKLIVLTKIISEITESSDYALMLIRGKGHIECNFISNIPKKRLKEALNSVMEKLNGKDDTEDFHLN